LCYGSVVVTDLLPLPAIAQVVGRPVRFRRLSTPIARLALGREFHDLFRRSNDHGWSR